MIASVREDQDENDIPLVESLVKAHIKKPSCLICLVVSCESMNHYSMLQESVPNLIAPPADLENQGARQLAKKINPSGDRVIRMSLISDGFSYLTL
jgi:hypothetical protein